ncbi:MAG: Ig-like domain-containing protein [Candidatus Rokuibacteriota bacterium]
MLVGLLAVGALAQACTSNDDADGPAFPAGQTGDPTGGLVSLLLQPGPGGGQYTVTVFVFSVRGRPAENRRVQLHTDNGTLNPTLGVTDHNGEFTSILTCGREGGATVTAFSEGKTDSADACGAEEAGPGVAGTPGGPPTTP